MILASFSIVHIQYFFKIVKIGPLHGDIRKVTEPDFTWNDWFSGEYQSKEELYINDSFGFRNTAVRLNNEISYLLFNRVHANGVIVGKDHYLFEENYLKAWSGVDFVGKDSILRIVKKVKYIQDTLKKLNKDLILVFAPGKGSFFHEFVPNKYKQKGKETNHDTYVKYSSELGVNYMDFWSWFMQNKTKSKYPLYTKYGIHWSTYGKDLVFDSMVHYIEKVRHIDAPDFLWKRVEETYECREVDCDLLEGMNLLHGFPPIMHAYPDLGMNDVNKVKPCVLTIADSHYWGIVGPGLASYVFDQPRFYYYYNELLTPAAPAVQKVNVNLKAEIENHDVVIILATDATLPNFGWGFIQDAYTLYGGKN